MIPQVQIGAQPPWGAWLRMSTRQQHTHVHTRVCTYTRDKLLLGAQLGWVYKRRQDKQNREGG